MKENQSLMLDSRHMQEFKLAAAGFQLRPTKYVGTVHNKPARAHNTYNNSTQNQSTEMNNRVTHKIGTNAFCKRNHAFLWSRSVIATYETFFTQTHESTVYFIFTKLEY